MNRSLCHWTVFALSFACSSEPTEEQVTNPSSSSSGTTSSNTGGTSSQQGVSTTNTTSSSPATTTSAATTSKPAPSSQGSSSSAPQTSTANQNSSTETEEPSSSDDEESTSVESETSSEDEESSAQSNESETTSDSETTTSGGGGECVKGSTTGSQVLMIGESFVAASHEITRTIEGLARENGSLAQGESYGDRSASGTRLTGGIEPTITNQYVEFSGRDGVKYVLMDGGGNDCLQGAGQQPASALGAAEALLGEMASSGVEKVVYFFYPDPLPPIGNDSLKSCLDTLRPPMKELCDGLTAPKCYWLDLREVWDGHPEYTDDGIHPTSAGSQASGEAIWGVMVENCVAQ